MTPRLSTLVFSLLLLSAAAQAQNVMLSGSSAKAAPIAPSPTAVAPSAPETKKSADLWNMLPSTPMPQATTQHDDTDEYFKVPPAQLSGLLAMQKSAQSTLGQALVEIQQQRAANDVELKNNPTPERRAQIEQENQSLNQNISSLQDEVQKTKRRIDVMQSGNVSINDLSMLYNQ